MGDISIVYMCVCVPDDGSWDIGDIGEVYLCVCVSQKMGRRTLETLV